MNDVLYLDYATSTQDVLHGLAAGGAPAGTAVMAAEQAAGRGSRGRRWHSPRGGLWLSVLLRPATPVGVEVLSLRAGLATAGALAAIGELPPLRLKWPNDLMLEDRKAGGLLCEARWQAETLGWVAVGLGLNVANPLPLEGNATRLADYRPDLTPEALAEPVARAIAAIPDRGELLSDAEVAAFAARDWLRGRELAGPVAGWGAGIARDGTLIVQTRDGRETRLRSGSVVLAGGV